MPIKELYRELRDVFLLYHSFDAELKGFIKKMESKQKASEYISSQYVEGVVESLQHRVNAFKSRHRVSEIQKDVEIPKVLLDAIHAHKQDILEEIDTIKDSYSSLMTREEKTRELLATLIAILTKFQKRINDSLKKGEKLRLKVEKTDKSARTRKE